MTKFGTALVCLCLLVAFMAAEGDTEDAVETPAVWEGLWAAEKSFGPSIRGPVTLHHSGEIWTARVQGDAFPVERRSMEDGTVTWSFSVFDQGDFVGYQADGDGPIKGHWIQPPGTVQYSPYASPLIFTPNGENGYFGELRPLLQNVSLNIPLVPDERAEAEPGRYRAFLRNPERNLGVFFRLAAAMPEGDEIRFLNGDGDLLAVGNSLDPGERFVLELPQIGEALEFARRTRQSAPGFYPRRSTEPPAKLLRPIDDGDGWSTAAPANTGLDEGILTELVAELATFEPTGLRQPYIHGLLIAHRGELVVEEYFHGFDRDMPHDSRSAGKTIASVLLGIALKQGFIASIDEPVYPFFGGVDAFANPDPRKAQMTLRHLVTMSQGFDCDDNDYSSPGNEDNMQSQTDEPDWYRYALNLAMVGEPGGTDVYCTAGINLIGGVLLQTTKQSLPRFFHGAFAEPLNISHYHMNLSPTYEGYMGGGIRLRPRDFLKLGQLYLNGGVWNGQRLLSEEWIDASFAAQASLNEADDYGFAWWRRSYDVNGQRIGTYYASGNGGQLLFVVPELDLAVQINAGNYSDGRTRNAFRDRFMGEFILPAALAGQSGSD
ncbi:MAG: serine hydrolase domain-containing protein [Pseudomonadota bacterium]